MTAKKMLRKGYQIYLTYVFDIESEGLKVEDIPIVCEHEDVFPKDLPGLPPNQEIKFAIYVILGTTFISQEPYRMAPAELKELKIQLQELLDKGFIRPNVSSWGALVLFVKKGWLDKAMHRLPTVE